mmetsp:Transcript_117944/g.333600  ORF Transcript_117944/g.333600 Transcript_117944/m.333600 type:complete len:236 (-) Transcript_117944:547-1254(-)
MKRVVAPWRRCSRTCRARTARSGYGPSASRPLASFGALGKSHHKGRDGKGSSRWRKRSRRRWRVDCSTSPKTLMASGCLRASGRCGGAVSLVCPATIGCWTAAGRSLQKQGGRWRHWSATRPTRFARHRLRSFTRYSHTHGRWRGPSSQVFSMDKLRPAVARCHLSNTVSRKCWLRSEASRSSSPHWKASRTCFTCSRPLSTCSTHSTLACRTGKLIALGFMRSWSDASPIGSAR